MTRIDFHFNAPDRLSYGCRLVRKIHRAGHRIVVHCDQPELLQAMNEALWTFSAQDFLPHVLATDQLADRTPILLSEAVRYVTPRATASATSTAPSVSWVRKERKRASEANLL